MNKLGVILILWIFGSALSAQTRYDLPINLWKSANSNSCQDLDGFYAETETQYPPFAYGLLGHDSAVYICAWKADTTPKLVIWQRDDEFAKPQPLSCGKVIESKSISVGGITLENRTINVSNFYDLQSYDLQKNTDSWDREWTPGPDVNITTFVININRGVGTELICHDGKWYFHNYD